MVRRVLNICMLAGCSAITHGQVRSSFDSLVIVWGKQHQVSIRYDPSQTWGLSITD